MLSTRKSFLYSRNTVNDSGIGYSLPDHPVTTTLEEQEGIIDKQFEATDTQLGSCLVTQGSVEQPHFSVRARPPIVHERYYKLIKEYFRKRESQVMINVTDDAWRYTCECMDSIHPHTTSD